jgi:peptide chain release factor 1
MFKKLNMMKERLNEINEKLNDSNVFKNNDEYGNLIKELKNLTPIVETYDEFENVKNDLNEAKQILKDETNDVKFRAIAKEQILSSDRRLKELELKLKSLLIPVDENDDKSVIIEMGRSCAFLFGFI